MKHKKSKVYDPQSKLDIFEFHEGDSRSPKENRMIQRVGQSIFLKVYFLYLFQAIRDTGVSLVEFSKSY
jgi:hypothetical protein